MDTYQHKDLIEACKRNERQAQYKLYRLYSDAMFNICLRMLKNEMDAEDIMQNSFITVFRKLDSFRYDSTIGAWIKRIMINNCINFLKKKRLNFEELNENINQPIIQDHEEIKSQRLNTADVNRALMSLPDGYRVVFSLYLLEGYDHKEIAGILDISEATSKSQYSRAKKKMKEILTSPQFELS